MSVEMYQGQRAYLMFKLDCFEAEMLLRLKISEEEYVDLLRFMIDFSKKENYSFERLLDEISDEVAEGKTFEQIKKDLTPGSN